MDYFKELWTTSRNSGLLQGIMGYFVVQRPMVLGTLAFQVCLRLGASGGLSLQQLHVAGHKEAQVAWTPRLAMIGYGPIWLFLEIGNPLEEVIRLFERGLGVDALPIIRALLYCSVNDSCNSRAA